MGVNSLPETVTRRRRDCDLNPGRTAPESSTLSTRLPSHHPHAVALHVSRYSASMRCVFAELDPFLFDSHGAAVSAWRRRASCAGYQLRAIYRRRRTERGSSLLLLLLLRRSGRLFVTFDASGKVRGASCRFRWPGTTASSLTSSSVRRRAPGPALSLCVGP